MRFLLSDANVDADLSDIEVQEFSEEESGESASEDSESESDESTASDEPEWSRDLHTFNIEPFSGSHGLKIPVPVEAKAVDFFRMLFGEPVFDLIVEETNCYARQKLARSAARLAKWRDVNKRQLLGLNAVNLFLLSGMTSEMLLFFQLMFLLMSPPDRFPTFIIGKM